SFRGLRVVVVSGLQQDSSWQWAPSEFLICARKLLGLARETKEDIDAVFGLPFLSYSADWRRLSQARFLSEFIEKKSLGGVPETGCSLCPLENSGACSVLRSKAVDEEERGIVSLVAGDLGPLIASRESTTVPLFLWIHGARQASRQLVSAWRQIWDVTDLWPELAESFDREMKGLERDFLDAEAVRTIVAAVLSSGTADPSSELLPWLAFLRLEESEDGTEFLFEWVSGARKRNNRIEVTVEPASPAISFLSMKGPLDRVSVLIDRKVEVPPRIDEVPSYTHLSVMFGLDEVRVHSQCRSNLPKLRVLSSSEEEGLGGQGALVVLQRIREYIALGYMRASTARKKVIVAISAPAETWPKVSSAELSGDVPIYLDHGETNRRKIHDFLLQPHPLGVLLILPAWRILSEPTILNGYDSEGNPERLFDEIWLDRLPYDMGPHHRALESRFYSQGRGAGTFWSYRWDVRWALVVAQLQSIAEVINGDLMLLDGRCLEDVNA
ncbi:MAG: hypothetical protein QF645_11430, partial [Planctomycetota bacterium]|nr:hypothetical protein [Planctomycetota bacterium]